MARAKINEKGRYMLDINIPDVVAQLVSAFETYERALINNDIAGLNAMFWDSGETTRFGTKTGERLYGHAQIAEFRLRRGAIDQRRTLQNQRITTFGRDFGIANVEFIPAGSARVGRQT